MTSSLPPSQAPRSRDMSPHIITTLVTAPTSLLLWPPEYVPQQSQAVGLTAHQLTHAGMQGAGVGGLPGWAGGGGCGADRRCTLPEA